MTDAQVAAAFRVGAIFGAWERQNGLNRRTHSPSYESGFGAPGRVICERAVRTKMRLADLPPCECAYCTEARAIDTAYTALDLELQLYPSTWRNTLEGLCCNDEFVPISLMPGLRGMLDHLAQFFGVSKSKKAERAVKRPPGVRQVSDKPAPLAPPRAPPADKTAYLVLIAHMRPDLDEQGREASWEVFLAMKDREQFNRGKGKR